jgi:chemosensory pili system protein ChpC
MADTSQATKLEKSSDESLRCLVIPDGDMNILLPNTVVAEVSVLGEIKQPDNKPDWLNGMFSWRGIEIPLVSFSNMIGQASESGKRVAVLNTLSDSSVNKFIGLSISGIPRLVIVDNQMVSFMDEAKTADNKSILAEIVLDGEHVYVPDLDFIEKSLEQIKF